jgi:hypothetical protein
MTYLEMSAEIEVTDFMSEDIGLKSGVKLI